MRRHTTATTELSVNIFSSFRILTLLALFENLPALEQPARHMETSLPFSALERQQHLAAAVQVTEPFGMLRVLEMRPRIFVQFPEPLQTCLLYTSEWSCDTMSPQQMPWKGIPP